jgi:uncharacterized Zn finger protein
MYTTFRVPCPQCSPKTSVLFQVTEEFTYQGKVVMLTCVMCGYNGEATKSKELRGSYV